MPGYIPQLEKTGKFNHILWPNHCLKGSLGETIDSTLFNSLTFWENIQGKNFQLIPKGLSPYTEMFGAFAPQVNTYTGGDIFNYNLLDKLYNYDEVLVAGEAKTHCVLFTLEQIFNSAKSLPADVFKENNICLIEDCMSDIVGFEDKANEIWLKLFEQGLRSCKVNELDLIEK